MTDSVIEAMLAWTSERDADPSLFETDRLLQRLEALDRLEDWLATVPTQHHAPLLALCARLEAANERLFRALRVEIQRGQGAATLHQWARTLGLADDRSNSQANGERYDHIDTLLSGVLRLEAPASEPAGLAPEMVFYQPTPARHIFEFIRRTGLSDRDVLFDLGAGMGHVPLLAAICTHARCIGIEWEAAYVASAQRCARALGLRRAHFIQQDARDADMSAGTVFYLYTPFKGTMLREVLAKLRQVATTRDIRIGTLGPCTSIVAREPWLESEGLPTTHGLAVFRSVPMPGAW